MSNNLEGYCDGLAGAGMQPRFDILETNGYSLTLGGYTDGFVRGSLDRKAMLHRETAYDRHAQDAYQAGYVMGCDDMPAKRDTVAESESADLASITETMEKLRQHAIKNGTCKPRWLARATTTLGTRVAMKANGDVFLGDRANDIWANGMGDGNG